MTAGCQHGIAAEHRNAEGLWRCDACGRSRFWDSRWRTPKRRPCPVCHAVPIDVVACSSQCAAFLIAEKRWHPGGGK
jgi:hypothetical protein